MHALETEREVTVSYKEYEIISHELVKIIYLLEEILENDSSKLNAHLIERISTLESDIQNFISQAHDH